MEHIDKIEQLAIKTVKELLEESEKLKEENKALKQYV